MSTRPPSVNPYPAPDPVLERGIDSADELPPDVLTGLSRHAGVIRSRFPERVPTYCEQLAAILDELPKHGKAHEAPRFAAFLALLSMGEVGQ